MISKHAFMLYYSAGNAQMVRVRCPILQSRPKYAINYVNYLLAVGAIIGCCWQTRPILTSLTKALYFPSLRAQFSLLKRPFFFILKHARGSSESHQSFAGDAFSKEFKRVLKHLIIRLLSSKVRQNFKTQN